MAYFNIWLRRNYVCRVRVLWKKKHTFLIVLLIVMCVRKRKKKKVLTCHIHDCLRHILHLVVHANSYHDDMSLPVLNLWHCVNEIRNFLFPNQFHARNCKEKEKRKVCNKLKFKLYGEGSPIFEDVSHFIKWGPINV